VAVPRAFFGLDARFYLIDPGENRFLLARCPVKALKVAGVPNPGEELTTCLNREIVCSAPSAEPPKHGGLLCLTGSQLLSEGVPAPCLYQNPAKSILRQVIENRLCSLA
jgi:hypothetical protein